MQPIAPSSSGLLLDGNPLLVIPVPILAAAMLLPVVALLLTAG